MKDRSVNILSGRHDPGLYSVYLRTVFRYSSFCLTRNILWRSNMRTRIAVISLVVEDPSSVEPLNQLLFNYREFIIGRMGIPIREKKISLMSVAIDASENDINALTGKIGKLNGVSVKTNFSNVFTEVNEEK